MGVNFLKSLIFYWLRAYEKRTQLRFFRRLSYLKSYNKERETYLKREEKLIRKMFRALVLIAVIFLCSMVQAFDGPPVHKRMPQLPPDKETLFHQTMGKIREATTNIHEQIKGVEAEITNVLTAPEFNESLFLEKTKKLQDLYKMEREAMDKAVAKLASQFTAEERKVLQEIISRKPGPPPSPGGPMPPWPRR
jgi:uncharacterized membrane protein